MFTYFIWNTENNFRVRRLITSFKLYAGQDLYSFFGSNMVLGQFWISQTKPQVDTGLSRGKGI